jgi:hypothetical protein
MADRPVRSCRRGRPAGLGGRRRTCLTGTSHHVDQFLFVCGDKPSSGSRTGELTVRATMEEVRVVGLLRRRNTAEIQKEGHRRGHAHHDQSGQAQVASAQPLRKWRGLWSCPQFPQVDGQLYERLSFAVKLSPT